MILQFCYRNGYSSIALAVSHIKGNIIACWSGWRQSTIPYLDSFLQSFCDFDRNLLVVVLKRIAKMCWNLTFYQKSGGGHFFHHYYLGRIFSSLDSFCYVYPGIFVSCQSILPRESTQWGDCIIWATSHILDAPSSKEFRAPIHIPNTCSDVF